MSEDEFVVEKPKNKSKQNVKQAVQVPLDKKIAF